MDASEKYFKMCQEAKEIQKIYQDILNCGNNWTINSMLAGWVVTDPETGIVLTLHNGEFCISDIVDEWKEWVWLPRVDQLFNIAFNRLRKESPHTYFPKVLTLFCSLWQEYAEVLSEDERSLEKLWLMFVMDYVYNKWWDDKENKWVKR